MSKIGETNVDIAEVKAVLGHNSNDLGTLCKSPNINMFSKKKPINNRRGDINSTDWYVGTTGDYGLSIPSFSTSNNTNWTHKKPVGGETSPYCLGDFRGYDSTARPVIGIPEDNIPPTLNVINSGSLAFLFDMNFDASGITPTELGYGAYYLGVRVVGKNGVSKEFTTASQIQNQTDFLVVDFSKSPFNNTNWVGQTVTFQPFICSGKQSDQDGNAIALGDKRGLPFGTFNGIKYVNQFSVKIEKKSTFHANITLINDDNGSSGWKTPESTENVNFSTGNFSNALISKGSLAFKFKAVGNAEISNLDVTISTYFNTTFSANAMNSLYKDGVKVTSVRATPAGNEYMIYIMNCLNDNGGHAEMVNNKASEIFVSLKQSGMIAGSTMFVAATSTYVSGAEGGGMGEL
ncbi:hypothetical protein EV201_1273 [Ancylomarina subtilis]|uniref:Uncharacterized protein n=1 Tax=Ancylomarina subtilis TaxID=1639035 RepID=A0A4Q7VKB5_9BACT|nr:hypothetical protein [Ancylomarina subtilis]RZT96632.1 hypothetical protein EV201_1273 [Ancylomarina subtilis]